VPPYSTANLQVDIEMSLFERVQTTIATTLKVPVSSITTATRDADVPAWDSLGQLNLMMALEQTFGLTLDVEDFSTLTSVPAILAYIEKNAVA
jgi:acyl carrier protein